MPPRKSLEETHAELNERIESLQAQRADLFAKLDAILAANLRNETKKDSKAKGKRNTQSGVVATNTCNETKPYVPGEGTESRAADTDIADDANDMEAADDTNDTNIVLNKIETSDATTANGTNEAMEEAQGIVKQHIKLLHSYNEIRDVGQGLLGLIAEARGVRVADLYAEFGLSEKD